MSSHHSILLRLRLYTHDPKPVSSFTSPWLTKSQPLVSIIVNHQFQLHYPFPSSYSTFIFILHLQKKTQKNTETNPNFSPQINQSRTVHQTLASQIHRNNPTQIRKKKNEKQENRNPRRRRPPAIRSSSTVERDRVTFSNRVAEPGRGVVCTVVASWGSHDAFLSRGRRDARIGMSGRWCDVDDGRNRWSQSPAGKAAQPWGSLASSCGRAREEVVCLVQEEEWKAWGAAVTVWGAKAGVRASMALACPDRGGRWRGRRRRLWALCNALGRTLWALWAPVQGCVNRITASPPAGLATVVGVVTGESGGAGAVPEVGVVVVSRGRGCRTVERRSFFLN